MYPYYSPLRGATSYDDWPATAFGLWFRLALLAAFVAASGFVVLLSGEERLTGGLLFLAGGAVAAWAGRRAHRLLDRIDPPVVQPQNSIATRPAGSHVVAQAH